MICPHCGNTHPDEAEFCPITGKPLQVKNVCQHCGETLASGARFCPFCGKEQSETKQRSKIPLYLVGTLVLLIIAALFAQFVWPHLFPKQSFNPAPLVFPPLSTERTTPITLTPTSDIGTSTLQVLPSSTPIAVDTPTLMWQPSITPTMTISSPGTLPAGYKCPDKSQIELRIGYTGIVRKYDVNLRKEPVVPNDYYANVVRKLSDGDKVTVLDGPTCAYDGTWWKVRTESSEVGWVREMQPGKGRLIIRLEPSATPQDTSTPAAMSNQNLGIGSTQIREKDGMNMVYVPAGQFIMGSNDGAADEKPLHTVSLDAYWIDQTEVTNAMFQVFVSQTGYRTDTENKGKSVVFNPKAKSFYEISVGADWQHPEGPNSDLSGLNDHPVVQISWNDATAYCEWASARLPTEAEWEKAARGPDGRTYPWGNPLPNGSMANFADVNLDTNGSIKSADDGYQFTAPVGNYTAGASPYDIYDLAGNVWEWVFDRYSGTYYGKSPSFNPSGPATGQLRVTRGGSWVNAYYYIRSSARIPVDPSNTSYVNGFRCARTQ